ncbi:hypothetical protein ABT275_35350 [Streptomyces sp. NPDC001185]|uniref:hypothetical protein n=1 Tax=Streptomyces sp. NPDC001185 TaxID=3154380 RepID=UPI00332CB818
MYVYDLLLFAQVVSLCGPHVEVVKGLFGPPRRTTATTITDLFGVLSWSVTAGDPCGTPMECGMRRVAG